MDLAMALADEVDADIVVANDPDADRCAVAVPGPARLADAARRRGRAPCSPSTCSSCGARASTPPRSSPPRCWARWRVAEKQLYAETLTGFKWIGRVREPRLRLRGGARLLRRPGPREGQGRRLRADDGLRHRGPGEGRRPHAARPARRPRPRATGCTPPTSSRCGWTTSPRSRPWSTGCATDPPTSLGGLAVEQVDDLSLGSERRPADHRAAVPAGRPRPGRRTPVGDGAEDQVLPRGRRTRGGRGGRRRRRPHLRRRPPRRDPRRPPGRRRAVTGRSPLGTSRAVAAQAGALDDALDGQVALVGRARRSGSSRSPWSWAADSKVKWP